MHPTSRFEATMPTQLHALISDLRWRMRMIDADILEEERKAGISDPQNLAYPCSRRTCGPGATISG
jgi:hypothetical protein